MKALVMLTLAGLALASDIGHAVAQSGTEVQEQTVPGGAGDNVTPLPPDEHKGVIEPPDVGDKDIFTEVPNPEAGHYEEVIPPSELPDQPPKAD
jgi:hypothetical protein